MAKNLILSPLLVCLNQIWALKMFFLWVLPLLVARHCSNTSYHLMQFPGKLMNQTSENGKKRNFGPDFGPFGPNLGLARNCSKSKLSSYAI